MSDGRPRRGSRESGTAKVTPTFTGTAEIVPLPAPAPVEAAEPAALPAPGSMPGSMRESIPAAAPVAMLPPPAEDPADPKPADPWHAMMAAQTALGRGYEQALAEFTGTANAGMAVSRDAAIAMLGARSVVDAVAIGNDFIRRGFDALFDGAAKLSEIGIKTFSDASRPLLSPH